MDDMILAFAVVLFAYFVRGLVGFGSGLIAVPVLALGTPLTVVVPGVMALDFLASLTLGGVDRRHADLTEVASLLPFGAIGAVLGVWGLVTLPAPPVLVAMGIFVGYVGLRYVLGSGSLRPISRAWAIPAGLLGSSAGGLFGTSAPPYVIYLTHRLQDKTRVRATFSVLFVFDGGLRLLLLALVGALFADETLRLIAYALPAMVIGLILGAHTHVGLTRERLTQITGGLLIATGTLLIAKTLSSGTLQAWLQQH